MRPGDAGRGPVDRPPGSRAALLRSVACRGRTGKPPLNRAGTSLVEVIIAVAIVGVGIAGVASLTAASARILVQTRALDETHTLLRSFVDSAAASAVGGAESGSRILATGVLAWSVPGTPGADAWARFEHAVLSSPIQIDFVVPASRGTP